MATRASINDLSNSLIVEISTYFRDSDTWASSVAVSKNWRRLLWDTSSITFERLDLTHRSAAIQSLLPGCHFVDTLIVGCSRAPVSSHYREASPPVIDWPHLEHVWDVIIPILLHKTRKMCLEIPADVDIRMLKLFQRMNAHKLRELVLTRAPVGLGSQTRIAQLSRLIQAVPCIWNLKSIVLHKYSINLIPVQVFGGLEELSFHNMIPEQSLTPQEMANLLARLPCLKRFTAMNSFKRRTGEFEQEFLVRQVRLGRLEYLSLRGDIYHVATLFKRLSLPPMCVVELQCSPGTSGTIDETVCRSIKEILNRRLMDDVPMDNSVTLLIDYPFTCFLSFKDISIDTDTAMDTAPDTATVTATCTVTPVLFFTLTMVMNEPIPVDPLPLIDVFLGEPDSETWFQNVTWMTMDIKLRPPFLNERQLHSFFYNAYNWALQKCSRIRHLDFHCPVGSAKEPYTPHLLDMPRLLNFSI